MQNHNSYADARRRWVQEQERLHGCRYVDGECAVHGSSTRASTESQLPCICRSLPHAHRPEQHDNLTGRFPGDTEQKRFDDAAGTFWRTKEERETSKSPKSARQTLFDTT